MTWLACVASIGEPIALHLGPGIGANDGRIVRSSGTYAVGPEEVDNHSYERQACLPLKPWVALTSVEDGRLVADARPTEIGRSIFVMKAPHALFDSASRLSRHRSNSQRQVSEDAPVSEDHKDCAAEIRKICDVAGSLHFLGLLINHPGRETVTVNDRTRRLPGLHVDSWDDADVDCRHLSRNRMSINVGSTPRYFLYVPIAIDDVAAYIEKASGLADRRRGDQTSLSRQLMSLHPEIPAIRCRIEPGELYIAPTENVIHDGSSVGSAQLVYNFAVLGRMTPK